MNPASDALAALENYRASGNATALTQTQAYYAGHQGTNQFLNIAVDSSQFARFSTNAQEPPSDKGSIHNLTAGAAGRALRPQSGAGRENKKKKLQRPTTAQQRKANTLGVQGFG